MPEQILIHVHRRDGVATNVNCRPPLKVIEFVPEMQNRRNSAIENRVVRIAVLNHALRWEIATTQRSWTLPTKPVIAGKFPKRTR